MKKGKFLTIEYNGKIIDTVQSIQPYAYKPDTILVHYWDKDEMTTKSLYIPSKKIII